MMLLVRTLTCCTLLILQSAYAQDVPCDPGYYGLNCSAACGRCAGSSSCDDVDGSCPTGCELWWTGLLCSTNIVRPVVRIVGPPVLSSITNNSAVLEWDPLPSIPNELSEFYKYRVRYGVLNDNEPLIPHGPARISHAVSGLMHGTAYEFTIITYRTMGDILEIGDSYTPVLIRTRCNSPVMNGVLRIETMTSTDEDLGQVVVDFRDVVNSVDTGCRAIAEYSIEYRHVTESNFTSVSGDPAKGAHTIFLVPGEQYEVRLVVINDAGLSAASPPTAVIVSSRTDPPTTATINEPATTIGQSGPDPVLLVVSTVVPTVVVIILVVVAVVCERRRRYGQTSL